MAKVKVGEIVQIKTGAGYAYAQVTHSTDDGELLRVLCGLYPSPVLEPESLVNEPEQFLTFFPLRHVKSEDFLLVGRREVPVNARPFPLMRMAGLRDPVTHRSMGWWLYDGEREWKVGSLTEEQKKLPIRATWNDTLLKDRIVSGWRHQDEV